MLVLGIETSCDETSLCLLEGKGLRAKVLKTLTFSQIDIHNEWGGVVPEIAARNHLKKIQPLFEGLTSETGIKTKDISLIGVTTHPGLLGPLLTGVNLAKSISLLYQTPIVPVNHLLAHLEAIHLSQEVTYPYLGVLLSGGHTLFCLIEGPDSMKILASTIDDAAGEAFDKGGKIMGLPYPSGRIIDEKARHGTKNKYSFPIGLLKEKDNPNLSFSGVKTSLRFLLEKNPEILKSDQEVKDLCASYQEAIVQGVFKKFMITFKQFSKLPVIVGGGVACNSRLREVFQSQLSRVFFVEPQYCTDNASMIANHAYLNRNNKVEFPECLKLDAKSRFINKKNFLNK